MWAASVRDQLLHCSTDWGARNGCKTVDTCHRHLNKENPRDDASRTELNAHHALAVIAEVLQPKVLSQIGPIVEGQGRSLRKCVRYLDEVLRPKRFEMGAFRGGSDCQTRHA